MVLNCSNLELLESTKKNKNFYHYLLETSYEGGLVTTTPVNVKKIEGDWKINISPETLNSKENQIIKNNNEHFDNSLQDNGVFHVASVAPVELTQK